MMGARRSMTRTLLWTSAVLLGVAQAQVPLTGVNGAIRINNSDLAVLETPEVRKDLPCTVTPNKPSLGFDLKFHGGYEVSVPLKELAGSDNQLTMVFRVTPEGHPDAPIYFSQHVPVPSH